MSKPELGYDADEMYQEYLHIYAEANPNPNSMKFVFSRMLMQDGEVRDFPTAPEGDEAPLVSAIFERFAWVERVFFSQNFITLTKKESEENEWSTLIPVVRQWLQEYFEADKTVFAEEPKAAEAKPEDNDPQVQRIKSILDEYIRPAVEMDGGAIVFRKFHPEEGKLEVELQGSCSGCPSSMVTLKSGIQNLFSHMMPEVKEVVAEGV